MHSLDATHLQAALACLAVCAALGAFAPPLIARLPEPEPEASQEVDAVLMPAGEPAEEWVEEPDRVEQAKPADDDRKLFERKLPPPPPKELYTEIAALPHLALWVAVCSGLVGATFGLALGWTGALLYLVPLAPIGVVLMLIDWRTTLLPTRIIHPTYALLAALIPLAALVDRDLQSLYGAGWGWLVIGGWFWIFWWLLTAWGFGDVRLSRVLGPALGYLGWAQVLMGLGLILIVGAFGGLVLAAIRGSLRARVPYGPSMLVGAWLAVLFGPWLARSLGY
jgi:leader peptidase (prepilin peptidase)/N-methyltransferase